jgi:hypothetical protein
MHNPSFHRIAFLALALGTAGISATFAQTPPSDGTNSSTPPSVHHHHDSVLTPDEQAQVKKDYESVLASNADLKTASDSLKAQEKTLHEQCKALRDKIHAAMIAADPSVGPILDKLAAAKKKGGHHHHHDAGQPADTTTTTNNPTGPASS